MSRTMAHVAIAALVTFAFGSSAFAQAGATFEALDKNQDGKISLDEASANDKLFTSFKNLDSNKDGALTKEEFAAYQKS